MKQILIINPFGIGDVLFTTPVIHTLKEAFPDGRIGYLCNRRSQPVLEANPYIDAIFVYERDEFAEIKRKSFFSWIKNINIFIKRIKNEHFDIALDFSLNTQYGFFTWASGIKKRLGYDYKGRGRFLTHKIKLSGYRKKHIVEYYGDLLRLLNRDLKYKNLELYLQEEDKKKADEILAKEGIKPEDFLVGIIPGAGKSWGKDAYLKHWPAERFAEIADKIIENYKAKIIIMGDFSEKEITNKVMQNMRYNAVDLTGKTTLRQLAALLNKTKLLITNDGGPLHMAVALGIKTVSIFGPVDPKVYGPYPPDSTRHIVLSRYAECSPCYRNFRLSSCSRDRECLQGISAEEAFAAVSNLLK